MSKSIGSPSLIHGYSNSTLQLPQIDAQIKLKQPIGRCGYPRGKTINSQANQFASSIIIIALLGDPCMHATTDTRQARA
uniref:Uncharacterized protein n=1 Tax=Arundo donax TaxID=35708 RepID=A0A0A9EFI1_ARUDO